MSRDRTVWAVAARGLQAPCAWCNYNGQGYWQAGTHAESCPWHKVGGEQERKDVIRVQSEAGWRAEEINDVVKIRDGRLFIEVAHCLHCERLLLGPKDDVCVCGGEMYPVTKLVPLGVHVKVTEMMGK